VDELTDAQRGVVDRIRAGLLYSQTEAAFPSDRRRADLVFAYNHTPPGDEARRRRVDFARFSEPIVLEDKVWIGSNVAVLPGVRIGYGSVTGAGCVVTRDVPPMVVAHGVPARAVRPITDDDLATRARRT
jgi:acetyltransferase-like isoleucine patch superfamily enzyme